MNEILHQFLPQMTHDEKMELLAALKEAIAEELAGGRPGEPGRCPRCGCPRFVRKGRSALGAQRWLCRGCGSTFSQGTMGLLANSKLPAAVWMAFAECMADALCLRETASRCGVSLYTAWFMRMRACEVMSYRLAPARAGSFQVDDTHFVVSLSGNHGRSAWYSMPRPAHRGGQDGRRAGGSRTRNRVDVSCGVNEFGDCYCELLSAGVARAAEASLVVGARIPAGSSVTADGDLSYASALAGYGLTVVDPRDPSTGNINMVNALHSRLKEFIGRLHGVASRRMQRYLDWFCWREQFRGSDADRRELLFSHECEGRYVYTRELTHLEPHPFLPYWDRLRYADLTRHMSILV
ncbi:MAG: IS1595 family transposase [Eggerthellaceae bacterium]|nr:IS1595 family transposase [Eggerthellaceae bacterium]